MGFIRGMLMPHNKGNIMLVPMLNLLSRSSKAKVNLGSDSQNASTGPKLDRMISIKC